MKCNSSTFQIQLKESAQPIRLIHVPIYALDLEPGFAKLAFILELVGFESTRGFQAGTDFPRAPQILSVYFPRLCLSQKTEFPDLLCLNKVFPNNRDFRSCCVRDLLAVWKTLSNKFECSG